MKEKNSRNGWRQIEEKSVRLGLFDLLVEDEDVGFGMDPGLGDGGAAAFFSLPEGAVWIQKATYLPR